MALESPLIGRLHELARTFRENAQATEQTQYIQLMSRTAMELEELAVSMECTCHGATAST